MNMHKKLIALAVGTAGAVSVATLALTGGLPALAAVDPPGPVGTAVCESLPASVAALIEQVAAADTAVGTTAADLVIKKAALDSSVTGLVNASVDYVNTIDDNGNITAAGLVLDGANAIFADRAVNALNAMSASFDAQQNQYLTGLSQGYVNDLDAALCPVPPPTTTTTVAPTTTTVAPTTTTTEAPTTTTTEAPTTTTTEAPATTTTLPEVTTTIPEVTTTIPEVTTTTVGE